jgi:hypothetical protein
LIEVATTEGMICEKFASYEEALRRINQIPADHLLGIPLVFKELADGSQRLVRLDGKPLQWHRLPEDRAETPDEPIPLAEPQADAVIAEILPPLIDVEEELGRIE